MAEAEEADFLSALAAAHGAAQDPPTDVSNQDFLSALAAARAQASPPLNTQNAAPPVQGGPAGGEPASASPDVSGYSAGLDHNSWAYRNLIDPQGWKRALGLTARNVAEGVTAIPAIAGQALGLHSMEGRNQLLSGLPEPQTGLEKIGGLVEQGMAGGGAQAPLERAGLAAMQSAPANFASAAQAKAQVLAAMLRKAQGEGFKVPPATTNPTVVNRALESAAGKVNVQGGAQLANDAARTQVAAKAMGVNPAAPMTQGVPAAVIKEAGEAYGAARKIPEFATDNNYGADLDQVLAEGRGANASFPGASSPDVKNLVDIYRKASMTGDSAVSALNLLRDKASSAFAAGNTELGRAARGIAAAIQNQLERAPNTAPDVVQKLVAARKTIGIAKDVQDAMSPDGTVMGPELARAGVPPSSPLKTAADFAENYPLANATAAKKGSQASHLGMWGSILAGLEAARVGFETGHGAIGTGIAAASAIPAAREGIRRFLLSNMGQARAIPSAAPAVSASSAVSGVGASGSAAASFLNQLDQVEQARQASQRGRGAIPKPAVTGNSTL